MTVGLTLVLWPSPEQFQLHGDGTAHVERPSIQEAHDECLR
jgi:hypothetical protein